MSSFEDKILMWFISLARSSSLKVNFKFPLGGRKVCAVLKDHFHFLKVWVKFGFLLSNPGCPAMFHVIPLSNSAYKDAELKFTIEFYFHGMLWNVSLVCPCYLHALKYCALIKKQGLHQPTPGWLYQLFGTILIVGSSTT